MVADTPPGHMDELGHVACLQVSAALQPTKVAYGGASGFVAIAGTSCTDACVHQIAILQLASPGEQVLLRLPSTDSTQEIVCLEWSPYVADAMLLVAYRHGLVLVYSMSSPARCDPSCLVQPFVTLIHWAAEISVTSTLLVHMHPTYKWPSAHATAAVTS